MLIGLPLVASVLMYRAAARQTGSAFGVAIFGALMSAIQPLDSGVRVAVYLAIGLSLLAALLWSLASVLATRYARETA